MARNKSRYGWAPIRKILPKWQDHQKIKSQKRKEKNSPQHLAFQCVATVKENSTTQ